LYIKVYGKTIKVSKTDPRYLSGELKHIWKGKAHTEETKKKMSLSKKGKLKGKQSSQYGTCWIYNEKLKESKKIKKESLVCWLNKGWQKGRKLKFD
jgi:hypothetical protein